MSYPCGPGCTDLFWVHPPQGILPVGVPQVKQELSVGVRLHMDMEALSGLEWMTLSSLYVYPNHDVRTFIILIFAKDLGKQYDN